MKRDNQWRPSEHRSKGYAPYQRHKLRDANWVTSEEAASISKRSNKWHNCSSGIWCKEPNYRLEKNLLNKYVGKPFDKFLTVWHERTKRLRDQGVPLELRYIKPTPTDRPDSNWDEFYVNMEGIICKTPDYRRWHKKAPIKVVEKEIVKYRLKKEIFNRNNGWQSGPFSTLIYVLSDHLSTTDYNDILDGGISETKFQRLVENSMYSGINQAIKKWKQEHNNEISKRNPNAYMGTPGWCNYGCFKDLFVEDYSESVYRYIYPGTPEYIRIVTERRDAEKKTRRKYRMEKEEFDTSLLHNIEANRKAMEDEINRQKIIKHGFDENESFRGPEYHGKKRKKHKMAIDA